MIAKEMLSNEKELNVSGRSLINENSQKEQSDGGGLGNIINSTLKKDQTKN